MNIIDEYKNWRQVRRTNKVEYDILCKLIESNLNTFFNTVISDFTVKSISSNKIKYQHKRLYPGSWWMKGEFEVKGLEPSIQKEIGIYLRKKKLERVLDVE